MVNYIKNPFRSHSSSAKRAFTLFSIIIFIYLFIHSTLYFPFFPSRLVSARRESTEEARAERRDFPFAPLSVVIALRTVIAERYPTHSLLTMIIIFPFHYHHFSIACFATHRASLFRRSFSSSSERARSAPAAVSQLLAASE